MNWLAHLLLSKPDPAFRIGNLLPDILPVASLAGLSGAFRAGAECHRSIDVFTDTHPLVRQSIRRIGPEYRRFGGILVDVFYDHFLACDWQKYSQIPLPDFVSSVHASFDQYSDAIPPLAVERLRQIRAGNWLSSYGELSGIQSATDRIGARLRRPLPLSGAVADLERQYEAFHEDFSTFFPELTQFVNRGANA